MSKLILLAAGFIGVLALSAQPVGVFTDHSNVGEVKGGVEFDSAHGAYKISANGANIWGTADAFHYAWKQVSGDITLSAGNAFVGEGKNPHRKAVLMVRQTLDPGSPYADVAIHGDGMISLQYRSQAGQITREQRSVLTGPGVTVRLERHGDQFNMVVTKPGSDPDQPPNLATVVMKDPVYVGIGLSAHEAEVTETTTISDVHLDVTPRTKIQSKLSIYDLATKNVEVIYKADHVFEAPNWSPDGSYLMINTGGDLYRIAPTAGAQPEKIQLSEKISSNNDHGITKDGKRIAISGRGAGTGSQVFLANSDGSKAQLMANGVPSYFHGFSPDGKFFVFTGERAANFDLYRMSVEGGAEERLTTDKALDDGPDYSPDGKWIYLNSERNGHNQIWRIPSAGAGEGDRHAEHVVQDDTSDWFPHPSPNSKWMVIISFEKGTRGHPPNRPVELRLMTMPGERLRKEHPVTVVSLFGGQGTINVNSWSPDSKKFAFVSYERVPDEGQKR
ncbi:MAG TPA: hypothetical protein VGL53_26700 [Bryobacteraceae bacterium]|jgi:hypothetical protein